MNVNDMQCGKAGEYLVCADLILQGFVAYPSEQGLPYDVVIDDGGRLLKIQVKTTRKPLTVPQRASKTEAYLFHVMRSGKGGKERYTDMQVDLFALVALDVQRIAYVAKAAVKTSMQFRSYAAEYQGDGKPQLIETCKAMRAEGKTLKQISETTGKHFTYVQRLLAGKESNNKFGRYLHEFTIESALQQLA